MKPNIDGSVTVRGCARLIEIFDVQGVPAFRDFRIRDPRYFVIHFQAQFREFLTIS